MLGFLAFQQSVFALVCQCEMTHSISESYQDEEPRAEEALGECRPDGLVQAVVRARRRRRVTPETLSSSSDHSDDLTVRTSQTRNDIFYVMRQVLY